MLKCKCGRMSPGDRPKCIYCGIELAHPADHASRLKLDFQGLELWENGFLTITTGLVTGIDEAKAAAMVPLSPAEIRGICRCGFPMPIARMRTAAEADAVAQRLKEAGLNCTVIDENRLSPSIGPVRLRRIEIDADGPYFVLFNTGEKVKLLWNGIKHIIAGTIFTSRLYSLERRIKGGRREQVDGTAMTADEDVIDIYVDGHPIGYRIIPSGMDFSFLGDMMSMTANENMRTTIDRLSGWSRSASINSAYRDVREILGHIWPISQVRDSKGTSGGVIRGRTFSSTLTTSNEGQFLRFSRLQSLGL